MENGKNVQQSKLTYPYESKPPIPLSIVLGIQHLLVYIGGLIVFPVVVGKAFGLNVQELSIFVGTTWVGMGIATFLQVFLIGNKLPIVQGPSFSFILPAVSLAPLVGGGVQAMPYYMGGLILGGITEAVIGYGKLIGFIKKFISPITMSVVIMLIGLGLYKIKIDQAKQNWLVAIIVFSILVYLSIVVGPKKPRVKAASVIIGFAVGYVICLIGTFTGLFAEGSPLYVNFNSVIEAPWITLPVPFRWGMPVFSITAFIVLLAGYLPSIVESIGDYHAVALVSELPDPDQNQINKGIGAEGIGCVVSSILGGPATTSYTENIGAIAVTGVASRYVIGFCASATILLGLFRKFGTVIATVPAPVTGGIMMLTAALITGGGIQILTRVNLHSLRNLAVISVSLFLGIGVPYAIDTAPVAIAGMDVISSILNGLLGTPMTVGLIVSMILDNLLPGTPEERGITASL